MRAGYQPVSSEPPREPLNEPQLIPLKSELITIPAVLASAGFFLSGVAITTYNKWLLHYQEFRFPVTLIMVSMLFNTFFSGLTILLFMRDEINGPQWFTRMGREKLQSIIVPVALLFSLDITATNSAFVDLSVALTEVVKSCIPVLILFSRFYMGTEEPSLVMISVIALLSGGAALTSIGDATFRITGFLLAVLATVTAAAKLLFIEQMLQGREKLNPVLGLFYFAPIAFVSLIIPFFYFEYQTLMASPFVTAENLSSTMGLLSGAGFLAFFLNLSEFFALAHTSALTMCVVGISRLVFIVGFTTFMFTDYHLTFWTGVGLAFSLCGVVLYNFVRYRQYHLVSVSATSSLSDDTVIITRGGRSADDEAADSIKSPTSNTRTGALNSARSDTTNDETEQLEAALRSSVNIQRALGLDESVVSAPVDEHTELTTFGLKPAVAFGDSDPVLLDDSNLRHRS